MKNRIATAAAVLTALTATTGSASAQQAQYDCSNIGYCEVVVSDGTTCILASEAFCEEAGGVFLGETPCDVLYNPIANDFWSEGWPGENGFCFAFSSGDYCEYELDNRIDCELQGGVWIEPQGTQLGPVPVSFPVAAGSYQGEVSVGHFSLNLGDRGLDVRLNSEGRHVYTTANAYVLEEGRLRQIARTGMFQEFAFINIGGITCSNCLQTGPVLGPFCTSPVSLGLTAFSSYARSDARPSCGCIPSEDLNQPNVVNDLLDIDSCILFGLPCEDIDGDGDIDFPGDDIGNRRVFFETYQLTTPQAAAYGSLHLDPETEYGYDRYNAVHVEVNAEQPLSFNYSGGDVRARPTITRLADYCYTVREVRIMESDLATSTYIVAGKADQNEDGTWRYEYAVWNHNSDAAMGQFAIPMPASAVIYATDFDGVDSPRSGIEDYGDGQGNRAEWSVSRIGTELRFSTAPYQGEPDNFDYQDDLPNPLEWGSMYNFSFTCDAAPSNSSSIEIGLFRSDRQVSVAMVAPSFDCLADFSGDGQVSGEDLAILLGAWGGNAPERDLTGDEIVDGQDLAVVLGAWGMTCNSDGDNGNAGDNCGGDDGVDDGEGGDDTGGGDGGDGGDEGNDDGGGDDGEGGDDGNDGSCPVGEVADCDGSGECWIESWIQDGYCDGTAQEYGADLCCYDTDGGDCTKKECS